MAHTNLIETLPVLPRLALSYASKASRPLYLALFLLDAKLASIVRSSHEAMLGQIRLAWWREQIALVLAQESQQAKGEPVLQALAQWTGPTEVLIDLVSGWEKLFDSTVSAQQCYIELAKARGGALAALQGPVVAPDCLRMATNWALFDIATHLSDPTDRAALLEYAEQQDWRRSPLPRQMRPLAVLFGIAAQGIRKNTQGALSPWTVLTAIRIGWFGR